MENKIFQIYPGCGGAQLPALCTNLLVKQKESWPGLAKAYEGLSGVQTRSLSCSGYEVNVQFNPARKVSSGAAVDKESIKNRPCFLCSGNLPLEQKGILYQNEYLILCNPAPVFERHFTIVHRQHQPQAIAESISRLLDLAVDMSPEYELFYNGPACGASAPDHLHYQAIPVGSLPLQQSLAGYPLIIGNAAGEIYCPAGTDRAVLLLAGREKSLLLVQFGRLLDAVQNVVPVSGEPMINVICGYLDGVWRMTIIFRAKHRPDAFYREDDQRIFISLGTIDMAGVIITPLELDFHRLDCASISNIYREVSLTADTLNKISKEL